MTRKKSFVGSTALAQIRDVGIERRLTCVVAPDAIAVGEPVSRDDAERGRIVNAGFSPTLDQFVGMAMIDLPYAFPGVDHLCIGGTDDCRTVTPPVLANRSLYVNAQIHSYASRHDDAFPPIVTL